MKEKVKTLSRLLLAFSIMIGGLWGYSAGQTENRKMADRFGESIEQFKQKEAYGRNAFCFTASGIMFGYIIGLLGGKVIYWACDKRSRKHDLKGT